MKKLILIMALLSSPLFASEWTKNDELGAYTSPDIVNGNLNAMIKTYGDGGLRFGLFLPYDKCYVAESYPEPFAELFVLGDYHEFKLQCIGKSKAVVYPNDDVGNQIIETLIKHDNVCIILNDGKDTIKMCFSGDGVNEIKSSINKK